MLLAAQEQEQVTPRGIFEILPVTVIGVGQDGMEGRGIGCGKRFDVKPASKLDYRS